MAWQEPKTGPGLRPPTKTSTGPDVHGRVVNPPRYAPLGGLDSPSRAVTGNDMKIRKPGGGVK